MLRTAFTLFPLLFRRYNFFDQVLWESYFYSGFDIQVFQLRISPLKLLLPGYIAGFHPFEFYFRVKECCLDDTRLLCNVPNW
ncbi:hypothetical protein BXY57_1778 [Thermoflavifilum aggregans]|uniref:Uncharacterized protein n=1 Tax=Thermoflavifilum aggregans TaxID=454188 RepID=A0A2M9CW91_9BACT|nr:hypothetical protein BXY57_1778 [Thermoflavifilum aggregans]